MLGALHHFKNIVISKFHRVMTLKFTKVKETRYWSKYNRAILGSSVRYIYQQGFRTFFMFWVLHNLSLLFCDIKNFSKISIFFRNNKKNISMIPYLPTKFFLHLPSGNSNLSNKYKLSQCKLTNYLATLSNKL